MGGTIAIPDRWRDHRGDAFILAAVALEAVALWGVPGAPALRFIALAWLVHVVAGAFTPWRGTRIGFAALWLALGITMGLAAITIFSVGLPLLLAAALLAAGIAATPNRARWPTPWHALLANALAYGVGLVWVIGLFFI